MFVIVSSSGTGGRCSPPAGAAVVAAIVAAVQATCCRVTACSLLSVFVYACPCCCIGAHLDCCYVKFSSCLFHVCARQLYCFPLAIVLRLKAFDPRCIVKHQTIVHEHYDGVNMQLYKRLHLDERERERQLLSILPLTHTMTPWFKNLSNISSVVMECPWG